MQCNSQEDSAAAGAPEVEVTAAMIAAGRMAYYENSGEGWSNPGDAELRAMLRSVFRAMWSNLPTLAASDETTPYHPS